MSIRKYRKKIQLDTNKDKDNTNKAYLGRDIARTHHDINISNVKLEVWKEAVVAKK